MALSMTDTAVRLYPYQRRWFNDRSRFKIGMWSRQIGKTFTTTLEIVDSIMEARLAGRAEPWLILSRGGRQAREVMRAHIHLHARAYGLALKAMEYNVELGGQVFCAHEWDAGKGNVVTALPANPDTARGYSRNVYLDEFALHRDSRAIWGALYPSITRGWKIRVTSTPSGKQGKFYELMTSGDKRWSRRTVTIHDAVAGGYPADIEELREGLADEDLLRQEYEWEWLDEASAWLDYEMISGCEDTDGEAGDPSAYAGGPVFIGNDIAARNHLWVAWVLELVGDVAWTREIRTLKNQPFSAQDAALDEMVARYRPVRIAMDQTGMGEKPVEDAKRRYGASRVDGVLFNPGRKLDLATSIRERFEDRKIRIPSGDRVLRADLHSVQKAIGPTGAPRLIADDSSDGHADRFWACALACAAAADDVPVYDYRPAGRDPRRPRLPRGYEDGRPDADIMPSDRFREYVGGSVRDAW